MGLLGSYLEIASAIRLIIWTMEKDGDKID